MHKNRKQFCKRGHDTFIIKNYKGKRCVLCLKERWLAEKEVTKDKRHQRYLKNKKTIRAKQKEYDKIHAKEIAEYRKVYKENNRVRINEWIKQYRIIRFANDPGYKLTFYLRRRLRLAIKNNWKRGSAVRDLGCSIKFLKEYIESKFYGGMTWNNWGNVWELDHIKPLWKFNLENRKQFLEAVNYTNLQPLTILDHRKKTTKDRFNKLDK